MANKLFSYFMYSLYLVRLLIKSIILTVRCNASNLTSNVSPTYVTNLWQLIG